MEDRQYGLLIDIDYCTGCHTCEMACKVEHGFQEGEWGIELRSIGPREIKPDVWDFKFIPVPTGLCDLCAVRVQEGRWPTCVHHCQSQVMYFGPVEELAKRMTKKNLMLFTR